MFRFKFMFMFRFKFIFIFMFMFMCIIICIFMFVFIFISMLIIISIFMIMFIFMESAGVRVQASGGPTLVWRHPRHHAPAHKTQGPGFMITYYHWYNILYYYRFMILSFVSHKDHD